MNVVETRKIFLQTLLAKIGEQDVIKAPSCHCSHTHKLTIILTLSYKESDKIFLLRLASQVKQV